MGETAMHLTHKALTGIDIAIIAVYFTIIFGIGAYFARKERTSAEYFLAGRNVGWFAIGASLFVSNISTEHFIGLAGSGASSGLAVGSFEWLACLILLILGWVFVPFYLRSNVFTMPEFLERRFSRGSAIYLASISIIAYVLTKISVHLWAAAIVLKGVVGWSPLQAAVILVVVTGIYTVAGGLSAVIYTEVVQTLVLLTGAIALTLIGMHQVGGFAGLRAAVPASYFHMVKPMSDPDFPWTGIFFGAPILGIWYWCTDQVIVQRVLSARDEGHAKAGTIFAGFLKILPVFLLVLPGLIAFALFRDMFTHWGEWRADQRRHRSADSHPQSAAHRTRRTHDRGAAGGLDGRNGVGLQLDVHPGDPGFLQETETGCQREAVGFHRQNGDRSHGLAGNRVGAFHHPDQRPTLHLPAERSGLYQSSDRGLLHPGNSLDAA